MKCENILVTTSEGTQLIRKVRYLHADERVLIFVSTKRAHVDVLFRDRDVELSLTDEES